MNYILSLIVCSGISKACMPPVTYEILHESTYNCLISGYEESINLIETIGEEEVNKHDLYVKFVCIEKVKENENI
jgi:hypothetical protein